MIASKAIVPSGTGGSNPSLSAIKKFPMPCIVPKACRALFFLPFGFFHVPLGTQHTHLRRDVQEVTIQSKKIPAAEPVTGPDCPDPAKKTKP